MHKLYLEIHTRLKTYFWGSMASTQILVIQKVFCQIMYECMAPDALAWDINELKEDKKYPNLEIEYQLMHRWTTYSNSIKIFVILSILNVKRWWNDSSKIALYCNSLT